MMGFEPWGWVIVSCVYVDDARQAAAASAMKDQAQGPVAEVVRFKVPQQDRGGGRRFPDARDPAPPPA